MPRTRGSVILLILMTALFAAPATASAQWYIGLSYGASHTQRATVDIESPTQGISLQYHDVRFRGESFSRPPYWDWRVGKVIHHFKMFTLALEGESIHLKILADTSRSYVITPGAAGGPFTTTTGVMNATVQQFNITHGLNFALVNVAARAPLARSGQGRFFLNLRAGAGATIPHPETIVLGETKEEYECCGFGFGGSVGLDMRLTSRVSILGEYKVTFAQPTVQLAHGTGRMTAVSHQVAGGVIVYITR